MASYVIHGGRPLVGSIEPIGNKNAVLPMMAATLLTDEPVTLTHVPPISDVETLLGMMEAIGTRATYDKAKATLTLQTKKITSTNIDPTGARKMRASNMFLGPLLARSGSVSSVLPGGDKIGPREMSAHFDGFRQLGATVTHTGVDGIVLRGTLAPARIFLYEPSVTATENVLLAAARTPGKTTIENAACEPHVQALCHMLVSMGAHISGIGTNVLEIVGVKKLHGCTAKVPVDFIYVGTLIVLAAVTGGSIRIRHVDHDDMRTMRYFFAELGVKTIEEKQDLLVPKQGTLAIRDEVWARTKGVYSQPWPCFPSDMMSLAIVLATQCKGSTLFFEKMYPGRMFFADFLNGMGANIIIADPHRVIVKGKTKLTGRTLSATDLRAGMAYVAAGLAASGKTVVQHVEHIDRGYPNLAEALQSLGARIERVAL